MIRLRDVSKSFGDQMILSGINLDISSDCCVCLIGGSGTGKTLLARMILGLEHPDSGTITIDGRSPHAASPGLMSQIYQDIGVVFQANALFDSLTIRENIGLRLDEAGHSRAETDALVLEAVKMVGLDPEVLPLLPAQLSGGMQKRVGIARAVVHRPSLLVYDEPTSGLDPVNANRIDELIASIQAQAGQTSLVITHDMDSVRALADSIILLHDGQVHFAGTWREFLDATDPVILEFLQRQRDQKKPPLGGGSI